MINLNPVEYIFVHHTAVSRAVNSDQWNATNNYHKETFGMLSSLGYYVGYNYEIAADGTVRQARQEGEETAAVKGYNFNSVSIALDGNFDLEMPTPEQTKALAVLLIRIIIRHGVSITNVLPHRWACGNPPYKSCPGKLLADSWARDLVVHFNGNVTPAVGAIINSNTSQSNEDKEAE